MQLGFGGLEASFLMKKIMFSGKGGFGSVFIGKYDGKQVAIKQLDVLHKEKVKNESFCAELNVFRLDHPNIVKILTFTCNSTVTQVLIYFTNLLHVPMFDSAKQLI